MNSIGNESTPVFINERGVPQVCTGIHSGGGGQFISSDSRIFNEVEYLFPESWANGRYDDYTVQNDCFLFYQFQIKQDGRIVNNDKIFDMSIILSNNTEIPVDSINSISMGSDRVCGYVVCKAGTTIRLKNKSGAALPASTVDCPLFYKLTEVGPLSTSNTFSGLISSTSSVLRTIEYLFPEDWNAHAYRDYIIANDCMLFYKMQIKSDGRIVNDANKFTISIVAGDSEFVVDSVNSVSTGDDVRTGSICCKAGTKIRMRNDSSETLGKSTVDYPLFYILKEIA